MAKTVSNSQGKDSRVEDFLNDKLQTVADLDTLESLLSSVKDQQVLLRHQLTQAETVLSQARHGAGEHSYQITTKVQQFRQQQDKIDHRLHNVTTSQAATNVVAQYQVSIKKLQQLEISKGYVEVLLEVDTLSRQARETINEDPRAALVPYNKLQQLSKDLRVHQEDAEGAAVHLVDFADQTTKTLWDDMRNKLGGQFQDTLTKLGWPRTDMPESSMPEFEAGFAKLLILRKPDSDESITDLTSSYPTLNTPAKPSSPPPLLAFEVLVKSLALRFRYHFESDKPTNRVDKPEWYLSHILNLIEEYSSFFSEDVQPILDDNDLRSRDALQEFITAVIPVLRRKVDMDLPVIISQGPLSSHFVQELMKFDTMLRDEYMYSPFGVDPAEWRGVTHEVLTQRNGEFFGKWLGAEKEFALSRYDSIATAEDAWTLDYDSVESWDSKPTKSTLRLKDLLETVTDHYRPLKSFSQRLRFLIEIQISILDKYHDRLHSSIEAFKMLSSSLARAVHGTNKSEPDSIAGVGGLERLCRVYGSAAYMETCMSDWSEELFFLELWDELQIRSGNSKSMANVGMSMDTIAEKTSATIMSGSDEGALFDETASAYTQLRDRVEPMIVDLVTTSLRDHLKPYSRIATWQVIDLSEDKIEPSPELVPFLKDLPLFCNFLSRALSQTVFQRIIRQVLNIVQKYIMENIVMVNQFSEHGGLQFQRDVSEIWNVASTWATDIENIMRRLKEACILLSLSAKPVDISNLDADKTRNLKHVVEKVFQDNERARVVMEQLGIYSLTIPESRSLLQRRVESWS